jgi:hypothetical protein
MVGKEVRPDKQRLQAKRNKPISAITKTGLDGRAFSGAAARRPNTGVSLLE